MILVDINLLLYAVNEDDPHHVAAQTWLEAKLSGEVSVGLSWVIILGFIRLATNSKVLPKPLSRADAIARIDDWLTHPCVCIVAPGDRHWAILKNLLSSAPPSTNWVSDVHLAALAIERGCDFYSADAGFRKFAGLQWINPLQTQTN